jgi:hypothetical protein
MKNYVFGFILFLMVNFCYATTPPEEILSRGTLSKNALVDFILKNNWKLNRNTVNNIVESYILEANSENVNYEIAIAQMCYHTNFLRFKGTFAKANSNNFFGLSSFNSYRVSYVFDSYKTGIRAHIQHLKGYATRDSLKNICVDPRYYKIEEEYGWGSSPTIDGLSNKWAGPDYADKIKYVLSRLYCE